MLAAALLFSVRANAQDGYVVKTDSATVYLDITASSQAARAGARFAVYEEGGELVNPVTKQSLGRTHDNVASGEITETHPKYAVGTLLTGIGAAKPGQFFEWAAQAAPPAPAAQPSGREKVIWKSPALDCEAVSLALGDFDGSGEEVAVASESEVAVYGFSGGFARKYSWRPGGLYRIITVDAADIRGAGRPQLFVSVYDNSSGAYQTAALEISGGELKKSTVTGWLSRSVALPSGERRLYGQQFYNSGEFRASSVRRVEFRGGEFALSSARTDIPRFDTVYGFNVLEDSGQAHALVMTADSGRLRAQFAQRKNYAETDALFGKTPNVLRTQGGLLKFYPRVAASGSMFYAVANIPRDGLLSETFSHYKDAKLMALRWTGSAFEPAGETPLDGYACDIESGSVPGIGAGVLAAVVGTDGKTTIKLVSY